MGLHFEVQYAIVGSYVGATSCGVQTKSAKIPLRRGFCFPKINEQSDYNFRDLAEARFGA